MTMVIWSLTCTASAVYGKMFVIARRWIWLCRGKRWWLWEPE